MEAKKIDFIKNLANGLVSSNKKMTFGQLTSDLNANGFTTNYGHPYVGGRGVAKVVDAAYQYLSSPDCDNVAMAFTDANGNYAYPV